MKNQESQDVWSQSNYNEHFNSKDKELSKLRDKEETRDYLKVLRVRIKDNDFDILWNREQSELRETMKFLHEARKAGIVH